MQSYGLEAFGESKSFNQWGKDERCKCSSRTLIRRINGGMGTEEAIITPSFKMDDTINHKHPLYRVWAAMKTRCYNSKVKEYFGGNIKVCDIWLDDFKAFYAWAIGKWEKGLGLTRKDKTLDFTPDNCEFIDMKIISGNNGKIGGVKNKGKRRRPEVDAKIRATNLERYGVESPFESKKIQEKAKQTSFDRYGTRHPSQLDSTKKITKQNNLIKYGVEHPQQLEENREKSRQKAIDNGQAILHDGKTIAQKAEEMDLWHGTLGIRIRKYGYETAISMEKHTSGIEQATSRMLDEYHISYVKEKNIGGYKPDFVLEEKKIIIECDGIYWHSDQKQKDDRYHKIKHDVYIKNGYFPLFFRENEIEQKSSIVESIILNKLNMSTKIFGRKCEVKEIDKGISKLYFIENHLMGKGSGKTFGLIYDGMLVSAMQIVNKQDHMEISRFCNRLGLGVTGGFSKLLKAAAIYFSPSKIVTFIDKRYGSGEYLLNLGFVKEREHLSFVWVKDDKVFHRMQFKGNTGYAAGCSKLWDCGQAKYVKIVQK